MSNLPAPGDRRLLDRVRDTVRVKHYSYRTEQSYAGWIRRFILHHGKRHPQELGAREIRDFLSHLGVKRSVAPSTPSQPLCAILFLYREVLALDRDWVDGIHRARQKSRLPVVLTRSELRRVLSLVDSRHALVTHLLYGAGLRLMEALRLRVKDLDLERMEPTVRRTVQELLGHSDVKTTMIYTHVLNRGGRGVRSPLDVRDSRLGYAA